MTASTTVSVPEQDAGSVATAGAGAVPSAGGLAEVVGTGDHKVVGRLYLVFGLLGAVLGVVLSALVAFENSQLDGIDLFNYGDGIQTFFQAWSLGQTSLLFFGVMPMMVGLALYIVPLQVGAASIAFPRAAAASFWAWLVGAGMHIASVAIDGGLGDPTVRAADLSSNKQDAIELSLLSLGLVVVALMLALVCVVTTVVTQRPKGMTLFEVPLFSWSLLVAGGMWLLAMPVLLANLTLAWVDLRGVDAFDYGQPQSIWAQLSWFMAQPQIFTVAVVALGVLAEVIATSARQPQRMRGLLMTGIGGVGVVSFGAYAQRHFNPGVEGNPLYVVGGLLVVLPMLLVVGGFADTLRRGRIALQAHLVIGLLAALALLAGAAIAVVRVIGPALGVIREYDADALSDVIDPLEDLQGTVAAQALNHQVMFAALLALGAGIYYWGPKIFGRRLHTGVGLLAGLGLLGGGVLYSIPTLINGFLDLPEWVFQTDLVAQVGNRGTIEALSIISGVGAIAVAGGVLLVLADLVITGIFGVGEPAGDDPWGGQTLEWATSSPPPRGNFAAAPEITSPTPLYLPEETS
jgi:heme/copper-type cytochrome/quinol oxidase subunit 1